VEEAMIRVVIYPRRLCPVHIPFPARRGLSRIHRKVECLSHLEEPEWYLGHPLQVQEKPQAPERPLEENAPREKVGLMANASTAEYAARSIGAGMAANV